jgi:hypothetical protein
VEGDRNFKSESKPDEDFGGGITAGQSVEPLPRPVAGLAAPPLYPLQRAGHKAPVQPRHAWRGDVEDDQKFKMGLAPDEDYGEIMTAILFAKPVPEREARCQK